MSFPKYPVYKDSGVQWLGEVPEHWALKRLGHFFDERRERASDTEFEPLSVTKHGIVPRLESAAKTQDGDNRKKVLAGDFVINSRSDRKGSSGLSPLDGSVSLICTVLIPTGLHGPYIHHLFRSELFQEEYYRWGKGIVADLWSTNFSDMKNIVLGVPSEAEQTQIARFLDHETARIDALIEEQQRLIELLKEKRQAVISHAVTKGLDPTVSMKDSGVEWLGEVPAHWVVSKLKFMTDRVVDCPHETPNYDPDGNYLVIRTADIDQGTLKPEQMYRLDRNEYVHRTRRASLEKSDIVYGREGERWGHAALIPESDLYALGQRMMQFRVSAHVCPEYFMFQLNSIAVYRQGEVDTVGATSPHVNISTIINYQMMIPPKEEQTRISNYLNKTLRDLDSLINESTDAMGLLQERRSALISAAVTGKIDVRDWQPPVSTQAPKFEVAEAV
ncbi:type I restriction enzyme, S subunit [Atopomonas hussainii]|uniref:Type I restriction enzyme, S subunit n=1 Tax=Atopomonas hussainii TaxID=1429083 RepID=A0A1H7NZ88_9GAMM|nr:restriction endonuclease subunit S [Atopomonas hussainii]SEL28862.1 type I restriction enzyme, S subunit [Atopomonas hussainii]